MSSPDGNTGYIRKGSDILRTFRTMQNERYKIFQQQDVDKGRFDVTFEIEGKKLHAHSIFLTSVSEPLDSWLSDRWTTKDEVIKIEAYSYDEFYEFLAFLYTSEYKLTEENIIKMTDMAEFYGVQCLKELCDEFLVKKEKTVETIDELFDFAGKYSLPKFRNSVRSFFWNHYEIMCKSDAFISFEKPFVAYLLAVDISLYKKEIIFEVIYKWAEHRVLKDQTVDGDLNRQNAVKAELSKFLHKFNFSEMDIDFLKDFVVEKGFLLSATKLSQLFLFHNCEERLDLGATFKKTYELAEKQAMKKQEMFPEDNFIFRDTVNAYLVDVMPNVKFSNMKFMSLQFAVEKGYYLSPAELSQFFLYHDRSYRREESFKNTYELAEKQALMKHEMFPDETFDLATSINAYLVDVIPHVKFSKMSCDFLTNFVLEKGFLLSPADVTQHFLSKLKSLTYFGASDPESSFKRIVNLAEKFALKKQEKFPEDNFNLINSVKAYLVHVLPNVDFSKVDNSILSGFIVSNGIISEEHANQLFETEVEIKNNGKSITGTFKDVHRIRLILKTKNNGEKYVTRQNTTKIRFSRLKFRIPKTPSTVEKMKGCDWYFCFDADGILTFKHHSIVERSDYLLAEMKSRKKFKLVPGETTFLTVRLKNV